MLFGKKEDEVSALIEEHASSIQMCLATIVKGITAYLTGDYCLCESMREDIVAYEHQADIKRREIQLRLYQGAFLPLYRDNVYFFIDLFDSVADRTKGIANVLVLERPSVPDDLVEDLLFLLERTVAPFSHLRNAIMQFGEDRKVVLKEAQEIERFEHEVDTIEYHIRKKVFDSQLSLAEKLQLRTFVLNLASISDLIEDCSDMLEVMATSEQRRSMMASMTVLTAL
jgi:predicted phosphate transport protein (TIGR00153 family)